MARMTFLTGKLTESGSLWWQSLVSTEHSVSHSPTVSHWVTPDLRVSEANRPACLALSGTQAGSEAGTTHHQLILPRPHHPTDAGPQLSSARTLIGQRGLVPRFHWLIVDSVRATLSSFSRNKSWLCENYRRRVIHIDTAQNIDTWSLHTDGELQYVILRYKTMG